MRNKYLFNFDLLIDLTEFPTPTLKKMKQLIISISSITENMNEQKYILVSLYSIAFLVKFIQQAASQHILEPGTHTHNTQKSLGYNKMNALLHSAPCRRER